jgi:eukaryotic-like serine/threonine-protein kinase
VRELQIQVERSAGRSVAVTAAAAAAMPLFREMFPEEVLSPGQIVSVTSVTLLLVELCDSRELYRTLGDGPAFSSIRRSLQTIDSAVRSAGGAVVKYVGETVVCTFADSEAAGRLALALLQSTDPSTGGLSSPVRIALHRGPALVTTINDRLDYFGETVHAVTRMLHLANQKELLVSSVCAGEVFSDAARSAGLECHIAPFTLPDSLEILVQCRQRHSSDVVDHS